MNITHLEDRYLDVLDIALNGLQVAIWQKMKLCQQIEEMSRDDEQKYQMMMTLDAIQESIILASNALISFSNDFEDYVAQHQTLDNQPSQHLK